MPPRASLPQNVSVFSNSKVSGSTSPDRNEEESNAALSTSPGLRKSEEIAGCTVCLQKAPPPWGVTAPFRGLSQRPRNPLRSPRGASLLCLSLSPKTQPSAFKRTRHRNAPQINQEGRASPLFSSSSTFQGALLGRGTSYSPSLTRNERASPVSHHSVQLRDSRKHEKNYYLLNSTLYPEPVFCKLGSLQRGRSAGRGRRGLEVSWCMCSIFFFIRTRPQLSSLLPVFPLLLAAGLGAGGWGLEGAAGRVEAGSFQEGQADKDHVQRLNASSAAASKRFWL